MADILPKFEFLINEQNIINAMGKIPIQYDQGVASLLEKVPTKPPCKFNELEFIQDLVEATDTEILHFEPF